jgi:hypothetical protein
VSAGGCVPLAGKLRLLLHRQGIAVPKRRARSTGSLVAAAPLKDIP